MLVHVLLSRPERATAKRLSPRAAVRHHVTIKPGRVLIFPFSFNLRRRNSWKNNNLPKSPAFGRDSMSHVSLGRLPFGRQAPIARLSFIRINDVTAAAL